MNIVHSIIVSKSMNSEISKYYSDTKHLSRCSNGCCFVIYEHV